MKNPLSDILLALFGVSLLLGMCYLVSLPINPVPTDPKGRCDYYHGILVTSESGQHICIKHSAIE